MRSDSPHSWSFPEPLPPGEAVRWQGGPRWTTLAVAGFHIRKLAVYFAALLAWRAAAAASDGADLAGAIAAALWLTPLAILALGLVALFAWLVARPSLYTITDRRVILQTGVALPMTVNIPFSIIASAALRLRPDGSGDIPLVLAGTKPASFILLWPHVRPWRFSPAEPMLRALPDARRVADILAAAVKASPTAAVVGFEPARARTEAAGSDGRPAAAQAA